MTISDAQRARIENSIRDLRNGDVRVLRQFEAAQQRLNSVFQPLEEAIAASEQLTQDDLAIRINTRD